MTGSPHPPGDHGTPQAPEPPDPPHQAPRAPGAAAPGGAPESTSVTSTPSTATAHPAGAAAPPAATDTAAAASPTGTAATPTLTGATSATLATTSTDRPAGAPPEPAGAPPFTEDAPRPGTASSPTARQVWTRSRGLLVAAVILAVGALVLAALSGEQHGILDPRSTEPLGSRAVAELLADQGVSTRVVTTADAARAAAGADTTLLVADPDLLTERQRARLHSATAASGGRTVLVAPGTLSTSALAPGTVADSAGSIDMTLSPGCDLPAARRAGPADTGGLRYSTSSTDADACYFSDGLPTLLRIPERGTAGDTVLVGSPDIFHNDRLDQQGNASLALQLLGSRPHVVWYLPSPADASPGDSGSTFYDLIPSGWLWGALQLAIAAALAAAWRARRLGPLVPERLPVVIRASETAEGRARLYHKADARDSAASALRTATRTRLAPLVGTPPARAHTPEALIPALSARLRTGGGSAEPPPSATPPPTGAQGREQHLHALLFGPPPRDDDALIALADQLDALEGEVRPS